MFEGGSPRLTLVNGVEVEAPLDGTLLVILNDDQPGVIGEVGTILGRHHINIASFALGRAAAGAVGIVHLDVDGTDPGGTRACWRSCGRFRAVQRRAADYFMTSRRTGRLASFEIDGVGADRGDAIAARDLLALRDHDELTVELADDRRAHQSGRASSARRRR